MNNLKDRSKNKILNRIKLSSALFGRSKCLKIIKFLIPKPIYIDSIIIFIITFSTYFSNISPSVYGGDSGDFLSAIISKGIPHPSGYPLYTLIGILFNNLPLGHTSAWRVGLSSALFASLTIVFTYLTSYEIVKKRWISLIAGLTLAFLYPFWIYAEVAEVFSLHCLMIVSISYLCIKYIKEKKQKTLYLLSFLSGLSLTNNLTIVLMFPSIGISVLIANIKIIKDLKTMVKCILLFILGLIPYIYIPIAAHFEPFINWDRAVTLRNFVDLVLRKDYGWINKNITQSMVSGSLKGSIVYWKEFLPPLIFLFSIIGFLYSLNPKKIRETIPLMIAFLIIGPAFIIYTKTSTNSIAALSMLERFYLPPVIFLVIFFAMGIFAFTQIIQKSLEKVLLKKVFLSAIVIIFSIVPFLLFVKNIKLTNLSHVYIGDNIAKDVMQPLGNNSFLFVDNDEYAFNTIYIQLEYGIRKDISIPGKNTGFDKFLVSSKVNLKTDLDTYQLERRNTVDSGELYAGIANLIDGGIDVYSSVTKVFIDNKTGKYVTIPYGLVYKFIKADTKLPSKEEYLKQQDRIWENFHLSDFESQEEIIKYSLTLSSIKRYYALGYQNTAQFIKYYYKDENLYSIYMKKAFDMDPVFSVPQD